MSYTSADRPGDPPIPDYRWVPGTPDPVYGSPNGCNGCAFRSFTATKIRCSRIPCQTKPGMVAQLVVPSAGAVEERNGDDLDPAAYFRWSRNAAAGDAVRAHLSGNT